jgi:hypothetical protein
MNWDNAKARQIRDNKGKLIGYVEEINGTKYVRDQHGTIGWTKPHNESGPGYSFMSHQGRVAHTDSPEYMLALKKQKEEAERQKREQDRKDYNSKHSHKSAGNDGSDPKYR